MIAHPFGVDGVRDAGVVLRECVTVVLLPPGRGSVDAGVVDGVGDAGVDFGVVLGVEVAERGVDDAPLEDRELLGDDEGVPVRGAVEDLVDVDAGL